VGAVGGQGYTVSGTSAYSISGNTTGTLTHSAISGVTAGVMTSVAATSSYAVNNNTAALDVITGAALGATVTLGGTGAGGFSVTGLGTVASGVVTEAASMTGPISIATAGGSAGTITFASTAATHGAVSITQAGTGQVNLIEVLNTGTITYSASGTTGNLVVDATAGTGGTSFNLVNYTASAGAHLVNFAGTAAGTGASSLGDTLIFSTGADTVIGGLGADTISLGTGTAADIVRFIPAHTGTATGFAASSAIPTTAFFVGGSDIINQAHANVQIQFGSAISADGTATLTAVTTSSTILRNGATLGGSNAGSIAMIVGNYTSSTGFFTPSVTGTDTAVVFDSDGTGTATSTYSSVILVGYVDTGAADTAGTTGIITLNA